ncbi:MAG: SDR family NAD(P)-dependent oxidoreductase [Acidimicrobiales bacterium]
MPQPRMDGKVAVITGGASGIGRACALALAAEGARVVIGDLQLDVAGDVVAAIESDGGTAHATALDVTDGPSSEALIAVALDRHGRLDTVVAAAGVSHAAYVSGGEVAREGDGLIDQPVAEWQRVLDVNLTGVMRINQLAARAMLEAGHGGSIVNIASVAAKVPLRRAADYCVSKAGVWMLTKTFALEMAPLGIRVNAIGPGFIETPMTALMRQDEETRAGMLAVTPMGRLGQPEEIASTAVFLASDESSYMTGQLLFPAGGMFTG